MAKPKTPQPFTVRNDNGDYLGCYRVLTAEQAIARARRDLNADCGAFRRNRCREMGFHAKVEE